jgi:hypothetical protein
MNPLSTLAAGFLWAWWAFVASRISGGGPKHPSYLDAVWLRDWYWREIRWAMKQWI